MYYSEVFAFVVLNLFFTPSFSFLMSVPAQITRRNLLKKSSCLLAPILFCSPEKGRADDQGQGARLSVYFYGEIVQESCILLRQSLTSAAFESKSLSLQYNIPIQPVNLYIQSYGGKVLETFGMVDFIRGLDVPVTSVINGYSASSATLISVSCHKRKMTKNSLMLLHQLSANSSGKYGDLVGQMENLDVMMGLIKDIYMSNSKMSEDELTDILSHDRWLLPTQCLKFGIVDEII